MIRKLADLLKKRRPLAPGARVLAAVSGGADSVAMLCALRELAPALKIKLAVAHLNHGIRGKAAERDARFVRDLARGFQFPFFEGRINVPALAKRLRVSTEMAARQARYEFLAAVARKVKADLVATAHTADDQAETVLIKLGRGAGTGGLAGIPRETVVNGVRVVRPMLDVTRAEIESFLRERRVAWREDKSNRDVSILRNRVRLVILPVLQEKLNPRIRGTLARLAEILREEDDFLDKLARLKLRGCAVRARVGKPPELDLIRLKRIPLALRRRVLRIWLVSLGSAPELLDFDAVERIEQMLSQSKGSGRVELPEGLVATRRYERLAAAPKRAAGPRRFRKTVAVPGETVLEKQGIRVVVALKRGIVRERGDRVGRLPAGASLDPEAISGRRLVVRSWRRGDRIKPFGFSGTKKLQDIFVDAKVPADERATIPVFECAGAIVWVPGYRIARGCAVKDVSKPALRLRVEPARLRSTVNAQSTRMRRSDSCGRVRMDCSARVRS